MVERPHPPHNSAEPRGTTNQGGNGSSRVPFPWKTGRIRPTLFTSNYTPLGRFNAVFWNSSNRPVTTVGRLEKPKTGQANLSSQ